MDDKTKALIKALALTMEAESYGALPRFRRSLSDEQLQLLDDAIGHKAAEEPTPAPPEPGLTWPDFLARLGLCSQDAVGNMPCDNGAICDRCSADWITEEYKRLTGKRG